MAYQLRQGQRKNYRELADTKLPRAKRTRKQDDNLYAIEVLEEKDGQVKIHYTGYSGDYDEWRNKEDIVVPTEPEKYHPYDHHQQLAFAVKSSLCSGRDRDPAVRLEVPFDKLIYQGGLMTVGRFLKVVRGEEHYGIANHQDLSPFLGNQWFIRGINAHFDFCAVISHTVVFHLHKKAPIYDHLSGENIDGGYVLIFKFVRFDGVKDQLSDFDIDI